MASWSATSKSSQNGGQNVALCGACFVIFLGTLLGVFSFIVMRKPEFQDLSHLMEVDMGAPEGHDGGMFELTLVAIAKWNAFAGIVVVIAGIIGCAGMKSENKCVVAFYMFLAFVIAGFGLESSMNYISYHDMLVPVMERQGKEFCNDTLHVVYQQALNCPNHENATLPCALECQDRTVFLEKLGGCSWLDRLCKHSGYEEVGQGNCQVYTDEGKYVPAVYSHSPYSVDECQAFCDSMLSCVGYVHVPDMQDCRLVSGRKPTSGGWRPVDSEGRGTNSFIGVPLDQGGPKDPVVGGYGGVVIGGSDDTPGRTCFKKTAPESILEFSYLAKGAGYVTGVCCIVFFLSTLCGCFWQYTLVTQRMGKKGAPALLYKLLCPCLFKKPVQGDGTRFEEDEDEDASDDESGGRRLLWG